MQLENIQAVLRPRSPSEAADLGLALTRRHWRAIMKGWLCLTLPLWGILAVLLHDYPGWFLFITWWLKPLYDRAPVFYLGRTLFSAPPALKEQIRAWPRLLTRDILRTLLWGRLEAGRALTLPVTVLEGLRGKVLRRRMGILKMWSGGAAGSLVTVASLIELAVTCGVTALVFEFFPAEWMESFQESWSGFPDITIPPWLLWGSAGCWLAAVTLVEPFFAGAGFGLYLNTRTEMEGWDIELVFRRLGERLNAASGPAPAEVLKTGTTGILLLLLSGLLLIHAPRNLHAAPQETDTEMEQQTEPFAAESGDEEDDEQAARDAEAQRIRARVRQTLDEQERRQSPFHERIRAQVREVLEHPDFTEHTEKKKEWAPAEKPDKSKPEKSSWVPVEFLKITAIILFWGSIAGLVGWLGWLLWKQRGLFRRGTRDTGNAKIAPPRTVMGLDVTPETLPEDIGTAAWTAWEAGERERAVRLLYRGALAWLVLRGGLPIRESDTEGDCLRHAGTLPAADAGRRDYFEKLTGVWTGAAYARVWPTDAEMETLCREWTFSLKPETSAGRSRVDLQPAGGAVSLLLTGILLTAGFCLTSCNGRWEERVVETGYKGEARKNPWLAAERFLGVEGFEVEHRSTLAELPEESGVLCVPAQAVASDGAAKHLLAWVRRGGHLIYFAEGAEDYRSDWPDRDDPETVGDQPLLNELGIAPAKRQAEGEELPAVADFPLLSGESVKAGFARSPRLDVSGLDGTAGDAAASGFMLAGPPEQAALVSLPHGQGRVTVLANAKPFRNRWIDEEGNALMLWALVMTMKEDDDYYPAVWFVAGGRISLLAMLGEYAWRPLLALGLLLVLWLWRYMPRFGPAREPVARTHLRFGRHLEEAGAFLWRQKLTAPLLDPARRAVLRAAQARGLPEPGAAQTAELAARSGLSPERVNAALLETPETGPDPRFFVQQMSDLQVILKTI